MPLIKVNGINLYYELHGAEDGQLLVLNNGILMNAATSWVFQTNVLSKQYRLLQYDCRGQGQSDHPKSSYSMELHADDLAALLDILQIPQAHVAGISYGGEVSQAFALKYPNRTRSLILADTVSEVDPSLAIVVHSWIDALNSGDPLVFFNATVPWNFSPQFIAENQPLLEDAKKRYARLNFPALIRLCECFLQVNFTSRLHEIKVPTCLIVGSADQIKGPYYANILHQGIPGSELHVINGAGHATCWENPAQFNNIILEFLARQKE
jgi:3-oxoadipate enol-lactonase